MRLSVVPDCAESLRYILVIYWALYNAPTGPLPHIVTQNYITGSAGCLSKVIMKVWSPSI